jgi:hypothetical protein
MQRLVYAEGCGLRGSLRGPPIAIALHEPESDQHQQPFSGGISRISDEMQADIFVFDRVALVLLSVPATFNHRSRAGRRREAQQVRQPVLYTIPLGRIPVIAYCPIKDGNPVEVVGVHRRLDPVQLV